MILPVTVSLGAGADTVTGQMTAHWLACKDICVPEEASFPINVPSGTGAPSAEAKLFEAHDQAMPRPSPWTATISADGTLFVRGDG